MADKLKISGDQVDVALRKVLESYNARTIERINAASEEAAKELVRITKRTSPVKTGKYRRLIGYEITEKRPTGNVYTWRAAPPRHRLTHLLIHGHRTRNKRRTKANSFLQDAIDQVQPKYDAAIEAAAKGD